MHASPCITMLHCCEGSRPSRGRGRGCGTGTFVLTWSRCRVGRQGQAEPTPARTAKGVGSRGGAPRGGRRPGQWDREKQPNARYGTVFASLHLLDAILALALPCLSAAHSLFRASQLRGSSFSYCLRIVVYSLVFPHSFFIPRRSYLLPSPRLPIYLQAISNSAPIF
jgi:hypothetical protein